MRKPLDKIELTQGFGPNPYYKKYGLIGHNGWDLKTRYWDTPLGRRYVYAVEDGVITNVQWGKTGYGNYIKLKGQNGEYIYAHLHSIMVAKNQVVKKGQVIGITNNTGDSSGPHLHFGWRPNNFDYNNGYLGYDDPAKLFAPEFKIAMINPPEDQLEEFTRKVHEYTGGKLKLIISKLFYPISVENGTLTTDRATSIINMYSTLSARAVYIFYDGNPTSSYEVTSYHPKRNLAFVTCPKPVNTTVIVHSLLHCLRKYINHNKLGPYIADVEWYPTTWSNAGDFNDPGWRFAEQYSQLFPYLLKL